MKRIYFVNLAIFKIVKREKHTFVSLLLVRLFSFTGKKQNLKRLEEKRRKRLYVFFFPLAYTTFGLVKYKREYARNKEKETMT